MKRITDSLLKRIVRQSLNESYGLLNESYDTGKVTVGDKTYDNIKIEFNPCVDGGFCIGADGASYWLAKNAQTEIASISRSNLDLAVDELSKKCNTLKMGKPLSSNIEQVVEDLITQYRATDTVEDKVRSIIYQLDFPSWCATVKRGEDLGYGNIYRASVANVGSDDYSYYVAQASIHSLTKSIDLTEAKRDEYWKSVGDSIENTKKSEETLNDTLLANAKKCGYDTIEAYRAGSDGEAWKCVGRKYTPHTGDGEIGSYQVSFEGYYCIDPNSPRRNPALVNKPKQIPGGVGYQLNTGNPIIDKFVYGVAKDQRGTDYTDVGVQMDSNKVITEFDCNDKKIQFSLSTNAWSYDDIVPYINPEYFSWAIPGPEQNKIVLTTDPDFNDNGKSDNSIQGAPNRNLLEDSVSNNRIRGFRHNLLTEEQTLWIGAEDPDVGLIQKALKLRPVDNKFGKDTQKAVIKFQTTEGAKLPTPLRTDGVVDDATLEAIIGTEAFNARNVLPASATELPASATEYTRPLTLKSTGPDVVAIQTKLGISTKGGYGPETQKAVLAFQQKDTNLEDTGDVDELTFKKIMAYDAASPIKYSGRKHNYTTKDEGKWIKVSPNTSDTQLSDNNGYFKILNVLDEYNVVIDAEYKNVGGGGSTQKVLFGEDAKEGTDQVIRGGGSGGSGGTGGTGGTGGRGRRSGVVGGGGGGGGNVDPERQRQRDLRKKEMCDALRQVKQYLNNTKDAGLTVDCKRDQNTRNQIMMALTGGSSTGGGGAEEPKVSTPGGNVRIY